MIDTDGSYLAKNHQQLQVARVNEASLGLPPIPPNGWRPLSENNFKQIVNEMLRMMPGNLKYTFIKVHMHDLLN